MKISPATWQRIEPLLTAALDMDATTRAAWLESLQASQPELAPILARMLATHERAERSGELETVPRLAPPPPSALSPGELVGPFRLLRMLGRGGMGEVWLAEQADGRVTRQVALKLPSAIEAGDIRAERFQRERDILAKLAHPNIARLYDAGVSAAGEPYLAMEYVEGEALDDYVTARRLPLAARLALLRQVLGAVAHAHRHLVVHRDLKPANILIDASGQVKLLDFGIAKLLEDEASATKGARRDLTRLGGRVMTLRYAAPEQASETAITTATDVYSLGVILHELATGASPYRALREGKPLTQVLLLQEEIGVPSNLALSAQAAAERGAPTPRQLARLVAGDLDAIILKALRRDPGDRYASIELFDEDIQRHLEHQPVRARAGTWRYLADRFARRHRLPIAMAAAVVVTMAVGLVVADRERRAAVAERERAERHFASVRKLANSFIFDVHGEIEYLSGALKAREMLVKTSLEYLDTLLSESGSDPALMYELATAYHKIGKIQGEPGGDNTGDPAAALVNFEKSKRLFVRLDPARPKDIETLREHTSLRYALARSYFLKADARWRPEIAETVKLAERTALLPGATPRDRAMVPTVMLEQAHLASLMSPQDADIRATMHKSLAMQEALAREMPDELNVRQLLVAGYERAAGILSGATRTEEGLRLALDYRRKALAVVRTLTAKRPEDRFRKYELAAIIGLSAQLTLAGDLREADATMAEALKLARSLRAADPANVDLAWDMVRAIVQASQIAFRLGDAQGAVRKAREALAIAASVPEVSRKTRDARTAIAEAKGYLAFALVALAQDASMDRGRRLGMLLEARALLADTVLFLAQVKAENLGIYAPDEEREVAETVRQCDEAIARLQAR